MARINLTTQTEPAEPSAGTADIYVTSDGIIHTKKGASVFTPISSPNWSFYDPYVPPLSPDAFDDEFITASGAWTEVADNLDALLYGTRKPSSVLMQQSVDGMQGIVKAIPSGDFSIIVEMCLPAAAAPDLFMAGVILTDDITGSAGNQWMIGALCTSGVWQAWWRLYDSWLNFDSNVAGIATVVTKMFIRVTRISGVYDAQVSSDGAIWSAIAGGQSGITPTYMGVGVVGVAGNTNTATFDFIRRYTDLPIEVSGGLRTL